MFQHAAAEGQKGAEQIIHWGCCQNMPQLNPEAGIPLFSWWARNNCRSYTWRFISCTDSLGLLLENQHSLKKCCHPLEDHQGQKGEKAPTAMARPHPEDPIPPEAACLRKESKTARWKEVWLQFVRPPKSTGHGSYPQRRDRKVKSHSELPRNKGEIQE